MEGGFDDIDFIKDLDKSDLDMIDIKTIGHQKKLLMAVQRLHDLELTDILDRAVEGILYINIFLYYLCYQVYLKIKMLKCQIEFIGIFLFKLIVF